MRVCYKRILLCYACRSQKLELPGETRQTIANVNGELSTQVTKLKALSSVNISQEIISEK